MEEVVLRGQWLCQCSHEHCHCSSNSPMFTRLSRPNQSYEHLSSPVGRQRRAKSISSLDNLLKMIWSASSITPDSWHFENQRLSNSLQDLLTLDSGLVWFLTKRFYSLTHTRSTLIILRLDYLFFFLIISGVAAQSLINICILCSLFFLLLSTNQHSRF